MPNLLEEMTNYQQIASDKIVFDLKISPARLDLIGKVLSLQSDKERIKNVGIYYGKYCDASLSSLIGQGNTIGVEGRPFGTDMFVVLNNDFENIARLKEYLLEKSIPIPGNDSLFHYCKGSYGLDLQKEFEMQIDIRVG